MRANGKRRAALLAVISAALAILIVVLILAHSSVWPVGSGPPAELTVVLAWNGEQVSIPAPVRYPRPRGIRVGRSPWLVKRLRWLRGYRPRRDVTAVDSQGRKYVANVHGTFTDPLDSQGRPIPLVTYVKRYDPNWWLESSTQYACGFDEGPVEWYNRHPNGEKNIHVFKSHSGLRVTFHDGQGQGYKEWLVNKRGQVYRQAIKQDHLWIMTDDLKELATPAEVPWGEALREFTEYYPGRDRP